MKTVFKIISTTEKNRQKLCFPWFQNVVERNNQLVPTQLALKQLM